MTVDESKTKLAVVANQTKSDKKDQPSNPTSRTRYNQSSVSPSIHLDIHPRRLRGANPEPSRRSAWVFSTLDPLTTPRFTTRRIHQKKTPEKESIFVFARAATKAWFSSQRAGQPSNHPLVRPTRTPRTTRANVDDEPRRIGKSSIHRRVRTNVRCAPSLARSLARHAVRRDDTTGDPRSLFPRIDGS